MTKVVLIPKDPRYRTGEEVITRSKDMKSDLEDKLKDFPWKNASGRHRTSELFYELRDNISVLPSLYTVRNSDRTIEGTTYYSLKKLYLEEEDITEFDFATKYLEGYEHWEIIARSSRLKPMIEQWRKELILKIKARSLKGIIKDAVRDNKYEANKFLITNGWVDKDVEGKKLRGRPSKQDIKDELMRQASVEQELLDDLNRIKELN